ncbi:ABC transporter permease [Halococcus agarilyticus]|uniref:ABC transporter permease n=1 Tax=Halococcus agarilyticus TaxID=1232219 RepID=UPI000677FE19|nr:ABC transporter permease [Halococcus agarilyticus]
MSTDTASPGASTTTDAGLATLVRAIAKKRVLLLMRYPVNTLSQFGVMYLVFLIVFFGGRAIAGAALAESIEGIIVGYMLWSVSITAYSGLAWNVTRESQWGTLEQLFMSPFGFGRVMAIKTAVNVLEAFLWGVLILALMLVTTGQSLVIEPVTVLTLGVLAVAPAVGVGFAMGALALLYKRVENAFNIVQFVLIGLIAAPVSQYPLLKWLPLAQGSHLLGRAMTDGVRLWELPITELAILVATAVGYLGVGYLVFHRAQRRARRKGVMGHY